MRERVAIFAVVTACCALSQVRITGKVETPTRQPLEGARVLIAQPGQPPVQAFANVRGEFEVQLQTPGLYTLAVDHAGYFRFEQKNLDVPADGRDLEIALEPLGEQTEHLEVSATPPGVDMETTAPRRGIGNAEIMAIPYPNTNDFKSALRTIPGVVRDNRGGLHINGGGEEQVFYSLNGFHLNDPLTGRFESRLSVESVQSAEVTSGSPPASYGKGSAGVLAIESRSGDDRLRYGATNFVPGFENRKGWTIGDWTPRVNLSGPIARGRAWFSNSFDTQYVKTIVRDLPVGEDRTTSVRLSDLLSVQVNLTPSNILHAGGLWNQWTAGRTGLTVLNPVETTIDQRSRQWFFHAKDQIYFSSGVLVEIGAALNRTFAREIPQGHGLLRITPEGRRGNHFIDGTRDAGREQFIASVAIPSFVRGGTHQIRFGTSLDRISYHQDVRRTGYQNYTEGNVLVTSTRFAGSGALGIRNREAALYFQDSWRVRPGVFVEAGLRSDWDRLVGTWSVAPRLGVAWSPFGWENTKFSAGAGQVYDASSLRLFSRPMDQFPITSYFTPLGAIGRGPALSAFFTGAPPHERPRSETANLSVEHHWPGRFSVRVDGLYRRGLRGFTYLNQVVTPDAIAPPWAAEFGARQLDAVFNLTNLRTDTYRSLSITVRHTIGREYVWMANYTASRALSNAVVDVNVDDPQTVLSNAGPMPWDSPHRFLTWGYLPTPVKNWAVAFLVDTRSGFPFSIVDPVGRISGAVNSQRFPNFLEANLHFERRFQFRQHRWALRFGANNLTGRINPDTVNNFAASSRFMTFYGGNGRSTNVRIRWLGRVAK